MKESAVSERIVVIIDDLSQIGPVEDAIVRLVAAGTGDIHVISTNSAARALVSPATAPCRVRLLFLMARLADRLIPVTGEDSPAEASCLQRAIARAQPDRVYLTSPSGALQRITRRDLGSRLRRLLDVEVTALPLAA